MDKKKSVFQCGAENGVFFGLYLSAIFLAFVYGNASFLLSTVGLFLMLAIPVVLFRYIRRYYVANYETATFSHLWALGTMTFLCGALICAVVTYVWLEMIIPDFIYEQAQATLAAYEQVPELKDHELTKVLRQAVDDKALPTPIEFVVQMLWFSFSAGVILSIVLAPLAKIGRIKNRQ